MLKIQHLTKRFGTAPLFTDLCMAVSYTHLTLPTILRV